jgi:hypothetical protein
MAADDANGSAAGWAVAQSAAAAAARCFGGRLRSVYALGSLAHGGFCPLVSDVDVAIVLTGRGPDAGAGAGVGPGDWDRVRVAALARMIRWSRAPLAGRLSLFWGTADSIAGHAPGGRFPALDRLDLIRHGVLIRGDDIRAGLPEPSHEDLVVGTAGFAVRMLAVPDRRREIIDARYTAALGPRAASKVALFPVRFLLTARTGLIGENEAAVSHYLGITPAGPAAELARAGLRWRTQWSDQDRASAVGLLDAGAVALYQEFAAEYAARLRAMGRTRLAGDLSDRVARAALLSSGAAPPGGG